MQHDFILLDRSGSMVSRWDEAIGSVNAYVAKLAEDKVDTNVTLALFDESMGRLDYAVLRNGIAPDKWEAVTDKEAAPRGGTPLNDAISKMVGIAQSGNYDKCAIIIMTDGHENASKEVTGPQAKARLQECRARGWQVIMLGADYDNMAEAAAYGNAMGQTIVTSAANLAGTMRATASARANYGATGESINFTEEDRRNAAK